MTDYTTLAAVKERLSGDVPTLSDSWDAVLSNIITQTSREFDRVVSNKRGQRETGWSFVADGTASSRKFSRRHLSLYVPIHDCVDVVSVTDGDVGLLVEDTDYVVDPLNGTPITGIVRIIGSWTVTRGGIVVSAKWGYGTAIPDDVAKACEVETIRAHRAGRAGMDDRLGMTPFGQTVTAKAFTDETRRMLMDYRHGGGFLR